MKQKTFTDIEYSFRMKKTKREDFLEIMDEIIPWDEWVGSKRMSQIMKTPPGHPSQPRKAAPAPFHCKSWPETFLFWDAARSRQDCC